MDVIEAFNNCMFLLGAGASRDAGCLLSKDMLEKLENLYTEKEEVAKKEAVEFLLSNLEYHSKWRTLNSGDFKHEPNIEELILLLRRIDERESYVPYPVTGNWADKLVQLEARRPNIFREIRLDLESKLPEWLAIGDEKLSYLDPIEDFFKSLKEKELVLDIFTLNYDFTLEEKFSEGGETWVEIGFSNNEWVGFDDKPEQSKNTRIYLYKLHGSLDWVGLTDGRIRLAVDDSLKEEGTQKKYSQRKIIFQSNSDIIRKSPYIIFGYGGKFLSVEPFMSLINEFKNHLKRKDNIVVIGYSFFDPYINNMIFEGLMIDPSKSKKLIIVNPQIKDIIGDSSKPNSDESRNKFADYISKIQRSSFLSDLPEFNIIDISSSLLYLIPLGAEEFYKEYFGPGASKYLDLLAEIEEEREEIF